MSLASEMAFYFCAASCKEVTPNGAVRPKEFGAAVANSFLRVYSRFIFASTRALPLREIFRAPRLTGTGKPRCGTGDD
jgi:hypothetical protein